MKKTTIEKADPVNTPYDSVYRTLITDAPELVIPLINEIYNTDLSQDTEVELLQNERFYNTDRGGTDKRITDCFIRVVDQGESRYFHLELQSTEDGSILLRIFEYGSLIAKSLSRMEGRNRLIIDYPASSLLALRSTRNTPDEMEIELHSPDGDRMNFKIPVLKIKDYTIGEIFQKKLYLLIPFHIFRYENKLPDYENDQYKLKKVKTYYEAIRKRLVDLVQEGKITELQEGLIRRMSLIVVREIANRYRKVKKGVEEIMGGTVLDYPEKDIYNRGIERGMERGMERGIERGMERGIERGTETIVEVSIRLSQGESEEKLAEEYGENMVNKAIIIRDRFMGKE